ncbi:hypothetical protein B0J15DRAFT_101592 [Fusarium solani]|uniref:Uncharacterized protein n=1 Tax=Fusarium solani TaxID=169388 RepID=A0A9P9L3F1_FUSSL|nr:uncharacterized protein B0J15DRAFT_101592 [Fusarium solani]KAH7273497.1 hypothetical protein B0J15DRAFT_101592 [Fusarium solani]
MAFATRPPNVPPHPSSAPRKRDRERVSSTWEYGGSRASPKKPIMTESSVPYRRAPPSHVPHLNSRGLDSQGKARVQFGPIPFPSLNLGLANEQALLAFFFLSSSRSTPPPPKSKGSPAYYRTTSWRLRILDYVLCQHALPLTGRSPAQATRNRRLVEKSVFHLSFPSSFLCRQSLLGWAYVTAWRGVGAGKRGMEERAHRG